MKSKRRSGLKNDRDGFPTRSFRKMFSAPPRGHVSVWMEEAKVPDVVLKAFETGGGTN